MLLLCFFALQMTSALGSVKALEKGQEKNVVPVLRVVDMRIGETCSVVLDNGHRVSVKVLV